MFRNVTLVTVVGFGFAATPAPALKELPYIVHQGTAQKVVQADAVVVGKVTDIEKEEVEVLPYSGATDKVKMRVAAIKIETGLVGAKNVTHVKVLIPGAASEQPADPAAAGGPFQVGRRGYYPGNGTVTLKDGQDGLFFLARHPTATNCYHIQAPAAPVDAKAENYKDELVKVKAVLAALAEPMAALKAEKAEDRMTAAATLIQKYRRGLNVPSKLEAIPAEETKAILKALAEADWTAAEKPQPAGVVIDYQAQPANLMSLMGLYPGSNGFPTFTQKPGESYNAKYHEVFKEWLAKSGDKFEIKKFVPKE